MGILSQIRDPRDLKKLSLQELEKLAAELRQEIVRTVAQNGGHLASSLGAVELVLALHTVFESPRDKIVWDVGHQAYAHKLITGRREDFGTLRQFGGVSGFPKPTESPHDVFIAGHSSTSISAALGLAIARDLAGEDHHVVAVIGDGALTGGLAFEGLSQAGHLGKNLLVVLNDNEMSIAPNVGAVSLILRRLQELRMNPNLHRLSRELEERFRRLPGLGNFTAQAMEKLKDALKYLVIPGMFFEELGLSYFGPVDGHQIPAMQRAFREAVAHGGPVVVHVVTKKGYGYGPAERDPERFHSVGPFDWTTGSLPAKTERTFTEVFGQALVELGEEDERLVAITAAMREGTGLSAFAHRFPDRFFDVGIAEAHAVTLAAGLAAGGLRPVVAVYSTFLQRAYDQILHDVCLQNLPVIFVLDRAGVVGEDGPTHHGLYDLAYLRHIPGMTVMAPKDERELRRMLRTALAAGVPVAIRYPKAAARDLPLEKHPEVLPWGRSELLRDGSEVALFALGPMALLAEAAADRLATQGISCAVVNVRFVKPLDEQLLLALARRTGRVVTIEEAALAGGFGSAVLELLAAHGLGGVQWRALGFPDRFIEQGPREMLLERYGLSVQGICAAVESLGLTRMAGAVVI
ncbi:MAG: 1-deoxy-D-xylulose-5-phosphate synthase [Firmicutes bacterium]|nr:1-deoxy-D-xylulose-5-phosphate synthase [Bacillota bacterium]